MKKIFKIGICGLAAVMMVSGCSKKADSTGDTTQAVSEAESQTQAGADSSNTPAGSIDPGVVTKLGSYKGVAYTPLAVEVSEEDVEEEIKALQNAYEELKEVDRAAKEGDTVNIDYVGMKDGVAFDGGTDSGFDLTLGSGQFIDGFEDGLIGAVKGQEVSLNLTFPANYGNQELAGQAVVFDVTVNLVQESVIPELTDGFVAEHTDSATVDELKKTIRESLEEAAQAEALEQKKADVFLKVVDDSEVTTSQESIQAMYEQQKASYEQQADMFGLDLATLVSYYGMDMETFEAELMEVAKEGCKQNAVVKAIAQAEMIVVEEDDLAELAENFGYEDTASMIENAGEDVVNNYALMEKVVMFLADNAVEE
ncbi:MAG: trigger factor [Hungatella sp.]|nr:trigger factor [Hungatella sp.]MCI8889476.1 trigger factor [Hungatella sp.]